MSEKAIPNEQRDILIVDDEDLNLNLLDIILQKGNYTSRRAKSGEEAVAAVKERVPDLVVMDVCMPGMDGFEACREIKATVTDQFVPVMLLTNLDDETDKVKGLDAGADEYVVKPPKKDETLARVRALLRIRDLQQTIMRSQKETEEINQKLRRAQRTIQDKLKVVGEIQQSFLPTRFPLHPEIEFARYYGPCDLAGGDYFDAIEIGQSLWGILIADVTGHGTPAAVVMAITHTLMHSFISTFHFPSTALKAANEKLNAYLAPTFYVTMFYGILNLDSMTFRYASAGHEPMMLYRARENRVDYLKTKHGFPLKLVESDDYDECQVTIEPGDKLILFTDGIVELRDKHGELFSPERLEQLVLKHKDLSAQPFVDAVIRDIREFHPDRPFQDDVTLFVMQRKAVNNSTTAS